jgi:hypothetical protein
VKLTLAERVGEILKDNDGLKPSALAGVAGVSKGLVSQWMSGERQEMGYDAAVKINRKYRYAINWLINGDGPKMAAAQEHARVRGADISDLGLEIGRAFDTLSEECKEHVQRQIELLRTSDVQNGRSAAQHNGVIKAGKLLQDEAGKKSKKPMR